MSNRLFQSVIHQMKDAVGGRIIGVIDETGVIIACSELVKIGEVRQSIRDEMAYSADMIVTGGCTYRPLTNGTKREYITFVEGEDAEADMISRLLAGQYPALRHLYQVQGTAFQRRGVPRCVPHQVLRQDRYDAL